MKHFIELAKQIFFSIIFTTELEFLVENSQPIKVGGLGTDGYFSNMLEAIGELALCILSTLFMFIILPFLLFSDVECELEVDDKPVSHIEQLKPLELVCKLPFLQRLLMCAWVSIASLLLGIISVLTAIADLVLSLFARRLY